MKWELVFPTALVTLDVAAAAVYLRIASWLRKDARRMKEYAEGDWHMYK